MKTYIVKYIIYVNREFIIRDFKTISDSVAEVLDKLNERENSYFILSIKFKI